MSELGLLGVARVYWAVFGGPVGASTPTRSAWCSCVAGLLTAVVGALMAYAQRPPQAACWRS